MNEKKIYFRNERGISLVVLIFTIIIMIILASAVIISLSNSGIINKANDAVKNNNLAQVKIIAQTIWAEGKLNKYSVDEIKGNIVSAIGGEKVADKYNIKVDETGVEVTLKDENVVETCMYSYNGIILSDINQIWDDKEKYPYIYMENFGDSIYMATAYSKQIIASPEGKVKYPETCDTVLYLYLPEEDMANEFGGVVGWNIGQAVEGVGPGEVNTDINSFFWGNHNILKEDGTVYFTASEPVPVCSE